MQATSFCANATLAATFMAAPASLLWLWARRRRDWRYAWAILVAACTLLAAGMGRVGYAWAVQRSTWRFADNETVVVVELPWRAARGAVVTDAAAAALSLACNALLPFVVCMVLRLPTPRELEHIQRGHAQKRLYEEQLKWEHEKLTMAERERTDAQRRLELLGALLRDVPGVGDDLRGRIMAAVRGA